MKTVLHGSGEDEGDHSTREASTAPAPLLRGSAGRQALSAVMSAPAMGQPWVGGPVWEPGGRKVPSPSCGSSRAVGPWRERGVVKLVSLCCLCSLGGGRANGGGEAGGVEAGRPGQWTWGGQDSGGREAGPVEGRPGQWMWGGRANGGWEAGAVEAGRPGQWRWGGRGSGGGEAGTVVGAVHGCCFGFGTDPVTVINGFVHNRPRRGLPPFQGRGGPTGGVG